jgi:hypothetical protein
MKKIKKLPIPIVDHAGLVFPMCTRKIYPIRKQDKTKLIRHFISTKLTMRKQINFKIGSYGLKHLIERHLGFHISNGELIISMIQEGFTVQPFEYGSPNARFNVGVPKALFYINEFPFNTLTIK